jgi:hypothetical protein
MGHEAFSQISLLQTTPSGMRCDDLKQDGPWYNVEFNDGRGFSFDSDAEGSSESELAVIAAFIAKQTHLPWQLYPGTQTR